MNSNDHHRDDKIIMVELMDDPLSGANDENHGPTDGDGPQLFCAHP